MRSKKVRYASMTEEFEALLAQSQPSEHYVLKLFITGTTPRSAAAIANIRSLCEEHLVGHYDLEVIDIYQQPQAAIGEQIIAAPTLVRKLPMPARRIIGDLSNRGKIIVALDLRSSPAQPHPRRQSSRSKKRPK